MSGYDESGRPLPDEQEIRDAVVAQIVAWLRKPLEASDEQMRIADAIERGDWMDG